MITHRPVDPSEIRALDFKREFDRSAKFAVPMTIEVNRSILRKLRMTGASRADREKAVKTVGEGSLTPISAVSRARVGDAINMPGPKSDSGTTLLWCGILRRRTITV
jgi:hypothetical protein